MADKLFDADWLARAQQAQPIDPRFKGIPYRAPNQIDPVYDFFDESGQTKPSVPLTYDTGHMFHLDRSPTPGAEEGTTGVNTIYMEPNRLFRLLNAMGNTPKTKQNVELKLAELGFKENDDYRFHPGQVQSSIKSKDQRQVVGNGEALVNALARGAISTSSSAESGAVRRAIENRLVSDAAFAGRTEVTDLAHELDKIGRGDLISRTPKDIFNALPAPESRWFFRPLGKLGLPEPDPRFKDPELSEAIAAQERAQAEVDKANDFNKRVKAERERIEELKSLFTNPVDNGPGSRNAEGVHKDWRVYTPGSSAVLDWIKNNQTSMANMTPEQREATVKQVITSANAKAIVHAFTRKAKTAKTMERFAGTSEANKTYSEEGSGYSEVWRDHGLLGMGVLLAEQGLESAPNTLATMAATTVVSIATGGAGIPVALSMGVSTAAMGSGSNFTQAFGEWAGQHGIKMIELSDPRSPSYKKLMEVANADPAGFLGQMNAMASEGDKRAIAEGIVTIALNKAGDWATDKLKAKLPPGAIKEGSPLWAMRGSIRRPSQLASGEIWKKSIGPKLLHAGIGTSWEAIEEGLTEVMTSIAVGDDIDAKTTLSSFLVGGLMGSASNVVAGVHNVDDPMASLREKVLSNEGGIDEVAEQISRNLGIPVANAKAALIRAKTMMDQFDELKKKYPPFHWPDLRQKFFQGVADSTKTIKHYNADQQQIHMANARKARDILMEEFNTARLEAWSPGKVKQNPRIKSLSDYLFIQNSNRAPGYDQGRYK
jgi:hypothetical protein